MSLSQVKLSELDAITMLQAAHPGHVSPTDLQAAYSCSKSVACRMLHRLESKGVIECKSNKQGHIRAFYIEPAARVGKAAAAQADRDAVVQPMRVNNYSAPLSGYERSLRDAASLSMAGRA